MGLVRADVSSQLAAAQDLAAVQQIVRAAARPVSRAHGATLVLRDADQCFYADEDAISPLWKGQRFPITKCISGWAMLHAQTVMIPDIFADDRVPHESYRLTFVKSLVIVPVMGPAEPLGAIGAYWSLVSRADPEEFAGLEELAALTADALGRVGTGTRSAAPA